MTRTKVRGRKAIFKIRGRSRKTKQIFAKSMCERELALPMYFLRKSLIRQSPRYSVFDEVTTYYDMDRHEQFRRQDLGIPLTRWAFFLQLQERLRDPAPALERADMPNSSLIQLWPGMFTAISWQICHNRSRQLGNGYNVSNLRIHTTQHTLHVGVSMREENPVLSSLEKCFMP